MSEVERDAVVHDPAKGVRQVLGLAREGDVIRVRARSLLVDLLCVEEEDAEVGHDARHPDSVSAPPHAEPLGDERDVAEDRAHLPVHALEMPACREILASRLPGETPVVLGHGERELDAGPVAVARLDDDPVAVVPASPPVDATLEHGVPDLLFPGCSRCRPLDGGRKRAARDERRQAHRNTELPQHGGSAL